jgi:hypothetical protein
MASNRPVSRRTLATTAWWVLACLVGLAGLGPTGSARAAGQPRIVVVAAPDVDGPAALARDGCAGCDGEFSTVDALRSATDPLPALAVVLKDSAGRVLERRLTAPEPFGAQRASFAVAAPGRFAVAIEPPSGWVPCRLGTERVVFERDFGATSLVKLDYGLWRGCPAVAAPAVAVARVAAPTAAPPASSSSVSAATGPALPRTGTAVVAASHLLFGLAAAAAGCGLCGLACETGLVRRS